MEVGLPISSAELRLSHSSFSLTLRPELASDLHALTPPWCWSQSLHSKHLGGSTGLSAAANKKQPEQIESRVKGNLENNQAAIATRLRGGIRRK